MLPERCVDHDPSGGLTAVQHALQVDGQDAVEVVLGQVDDGAVEHDAGDVAHDVETPVVASTASSTTAVTSSAVRHVDLRPTADPPAPLMAAAVSAASCSRTSAQ